MRFIDCAQGSPEWLKARLGIPTASQFNRIITKTGKPSSQADDYASDLVAERLLGTPIATFTSAAMHRGTEREEDAASAYAFLKDCDPVVVGFCVSDDGKVGASPDRVIGENGLLELKSPEPHTHIRYLLGKGPDDDYRTQLQGQLWVCQREWVDICSYFPCLPEAVVRVERDEDFIEKLAKMAYELVDLVEARMEKLKAMGYEPRAAEPLPTQEEYAKWGVSDADVEALLGRANQ